MAPSVIFAIICYIIDVFIINSFITILFLNCSFNLLPIIVLPEPDTPLICIIIFVIFYKLNMFQQLYIYTC